MKPQPRVNGNKNVLNEDQEYMRLQVIDLELKARYWEAQWKIRFYTLEAETLQSPYNEFLEKEKAKQEVAMRKFQEQIDAMNKEAGNIPPPSPQDTVEHAVEPPIEPDEEFFKVEELKAV